MKARVIGCALSGMMLVLSPVGGALAATVEITINNETSEDIERTSFENPSGVTAIDNWPEDIAAGQSDDATFSIQNGAARTALAQYTTDPANEYGNAKTCYFRWETSNSSGYYCSVNLITYDLGLGGAQCSGTVVSSDSSTCAFTAEFTIE